MTVVEFEEWIVFYHNHKNQNRISNKIATGRWNSYNNEEKSQVMQIAANWPIRYRTLGE